MERRTLVQRGHGVGDTERRQRMERVRSDKVTGRSVGACAPGGWSHSGSGEIALARRGVLSWMHRDCGQAHLQ